MTAYRRACRKFFQHRCALPPCRAGGDLTAVCTVGEVSLSAVAAARSRAETARLKTST